LLTFFPVSILKDVEVSTFLSGSRMDSVSAPSPLAASNAVDTQADQNYVGSITLDETPKEKTMSPRLSSSFD